MKPNQAPPPSSPPNAPPSDSGKPDADFISATAHIPSTIGDVAGEQGTAPGAAAPMDSTIPPELIQQALSPTFQTMFHAIATMRGAHWELKEFESRALILGWTPIVQILLAKLGNQEQVLLTLAIGSTVAIVMGKLAQDATKRASSTASTRTPESGGSYASSANGAAAKPPEPNSLYEEPEE